jgi:hypothetical protein
MDTRVGPFYGSTNPESPVLGTWELVRNAKMHFHLNWQTNKGESAAYSGAPAGAVNSGGREDVRVLG